MNTLRFEVLDEGAGCLCNGTLAGMMKCAAAVQDKYQSCFSHTNCIMDHYKTALGRCKKTNSLLIWAFSKHPKIRSGIVH